MLPFGNLRTGYVQQLGRVLPASAQYRGVIPPDRPRLRQ